MRQDLQKLEVRFNYNQSISYLIKIVTIALIFGAFFVLRYGGLWSENDTANLTLAIVGVSHSHDLINTHSYGNGYTYQLWGAFLSQITNIPAAQLSQLYLPIIGLCLLAIFGYVSFRRWLASDRLGMMAALCLFLLPEIVFSASRGSHEKLTISLTLLISLSVLKSVSAMRINRWTHFASWVIIYYFCAFVLVSVNAFLGSSFIIALTVAVAGCVFFLRTNLKVTDFGVIVSRLLLTVSVSWLLVVFVQWYVYTPSGTMLSTMVNIVQRFASYTMMYTPTVDPYSVTSSDWITNKAYNIISSFRYVLLIGSVLSALQITLKFLSASGKPTLRLILLVALYLAFAVQMLIAVMSDFLGLAIGSNIQVRAYTYFALFATPVFVSGLSHLNSLIRSGYKPVIYTVGLLSLITFLFFSVSKSVLEPSLSNRWLIYSPQEAIAMRFWKNRNDVGTLWVGPDRRVSNAYALAYAQVVVENNEKRADFVVVNVDADTTNALNSSLITASTVAWKMPLPEIIIKSQVYNNGEAQILHRPPTTIFQN